MTAFITPKANVRGAGISSSPAGRDTLHLRNAQDSAANGTAAANREGTTCDWRLGLSLDSPRLCGSRSCRLAEFRLPEALREGERCWVRCKHPNSHGKGTWEEWPPKVVAAGA